MPICKVPSMSRAEEIISYWFGDYKDSIELSMQSPRVKRWFNGNRQVDEEIRKLFLGDLQKAHKGQYDSWRHTPQGRLALILLLDQFPRNIFRNQAESFAYDDEAQLICAKSLAEAGEEKLMLIERAFLYLPLMHAEDLQLQSKSIRQYRILAEEARKKSPLNEDYYFTTLEYALKHHAVIQRFARFPHRNSILGRQSTPEEIEYLNGPDDF